jgi:hypothetical protein
MPRERKVMTKNTILSRSINELIVGRDYNTTLTCTNALLDK